MLLVPQLELLEYWKPHRGMHRFGEAVWHIADAAHVAGSTIASQDCSQLCEFLFQSQPL